MIPKNRGRPNGAKPLFAEDCMRLDANVLLAKARGVDLQTDADHWSVPTQLSWTDWRGPQTRVLHLPIVATVPPFGGRRWWYLCPRCRRRCGVLFLANPDEPVFCRTCRPVRYSIAYPGRRQRQ